MPNSELRKLDTDTRERIFNIVMDMRRDTKPGWIDRNIERMDKIMQIVSKETERQRLERYKNGYEQGRFDEKMEATCPTQKEQP